MAIKIYHNPRCRHSRAGLDYLKGKTANVVVRYYLSDQLTDSELREILLKSNLKPVQLVRTQEEYFKKFLKGKSFTDDEWIRIIIQNPKLLQRPIVVGKYKAVIGCPPGNIDRVINNHS